MIDEGACRKCWGCGQVASSKKQEPWSTWESLPLESAGAVLMGLVRPIPCPRCGGSGTAETETGEPR